MANQLYAITGRRTRPTYVDEINAQAPYLRSIVQQKKADAYDTNIYDLQKEGLGLEKERLAESIRSANENLALQKEQAKKANALGVVGLGGQLWLGSQKNSSVKDIIEGEGAGNLPGKAAGGVSPAGLTEKYDMAAGLSPSPTTSDVFSFDKAISPSSYKNAATDWSTYASGIGGGLVGAEAGEVIGEAIGVGGTKERRAVGGALGGAATEYFLGGGDVYSTIFSGLIGGATGLFSSKGFF